MQVLVTRMVERLLAVLEVLVEQLRVEAQEELLRLHQNLKNWILKEQDMSF